MHLVYKHLPLFFCFLFIPNITVGQQVPTQQNPVPGYEVRHFTDENGLPQNSIKAIVRDAGGNIWLATERGLVRFDGTRFVNFDNLGNSFAARSISGFHLDPKSRTGDLLAMTSDEAWIRMIDGKAAIDSSLKGYPLHWSANVSKVRDLHLVEALPDLNEAALTHYRHGIATIYPTPGGNHFVYDEKNLGYYVNNKMAKLLPFPGKSFFRFFRLGESLYFLDENLKLTQFPGNHPPVASMLTGTISQDPNYKSSKQHQIFWNNCSNQAFIATGQRLYYLQPAKNGSLVSTLVLDGFDFQGNDIKTVFMDMETGRLFLGSQLHGLYILSKKQFRTVIDPSASADNVYYGQTLFDGKKIATVKGVVFSLDSGNLGAVSPQLKLIEKSVDWDKYNILKDRAGTIWCKRRETLFRFDSSGERIIATWTMADEIKQLYQGPDGRIWIGTNSLGLYYIDPSQPGTQPQFFAGNHLSNISWIQHQNREILWVGTGKGLYKIHLPSKKIFRVTGLAGIYIRSLYIPDSHNELWITTYSNGVFLLKEDKLTHFPPDKELYLSSAHCIVEDKNGFFWITTNKGLFQVSRADLLTYAKKPFELYYHYYSKVAGFNTNEFNGGCQPCAIKTPGGIVSLPSIDGLVWFVPERVRPELPRQQIFIDKADDGDSSMVFDQDNVLVRAGVPQILVKISTPYFGDSYNLKMSYRIFKGDEPLTEWKALEESNNIAIPFRGGGKYTLSVRKISGFGVNNYNEVHLGISVERQWHETWWFFGIAAAVIVLLFYSILRRRIKAIKRQNLALEVKVRERTEHLEKTLSILSDSEKQLEQQLRLQIHMIASISHDIRTPVKHMSYALDYSQALIEENKLDSAVAFISQLKQGVEKMYHMVDNLVNFIKPEVRGASNTATDVKLIELINEKLMLFRQIAAASNADIQVDVAPEETVFTDPKLLGIIIHNLIDNAIKIRPGNTLKIYLRREDADVHLIFEDNGPGMPAELLKWLNAANPGEGVTPPAGYEGLGLLLLKQICQFLRLDLYVINRPGASIHLIFGGK
ncbi:ligand-binding sensor domain-containing protein [Dyadobacter sp. OTU695]|uniref:ligand-binding sensor domain-containing protein n=1 Tax=Dyadobacter sp. OTU695 TaxID=3043860 RepID=UPI00313AA3ED